MQQLRELERQGLVGPRGVLEALANTVGQTAVTAGSGLGGLWELLASGGDIKSAVDRIHSIQSAGSDALPQLSPEGQRAMANAMQVMQPIGEALQAGGQGAGNYVLDKTGSPLLATAAHTLIEGAPDIAAGAFALKPRPRVSGSTGLITAGQAAKPTAPTSLLPAPAPKPAPKSLLPAPQPKLPKPNPFAGVESIDPSLPKKPRTAGVNPNLPSGLNPNRSTNRYGEAGFSSKLENALLDIQAKEGVPDSVTGAWLGKQLKGRGVTTDELDWSGVAPNTLKGSNKVSITGLLGEINPPRVNTYEQFGEGDLDAANSEWSFSSDLNDSEDFLDREQWTGIDADLDAEQFYNYLTFSNDINVGTNKLSEWYSQNFGGTVEQRHAELKAMMENAGDADTFRADLLDLDPTGDFVKYFDNKAGEFASRQYNENPARYQTADVRTADGQTHTVEIMGQVDEDLPFIIKVDGEPLEQPPRGGWSYGHQPLYPDVYSFDEAQIQATQYINENFGGMGGGDEVSWASSVVGEPEGFQENVVLTMDDIDYENLTHFEGVKGNIGHFRASERTTAEGINTYHIDELQSDIQSDARKAGGFKTGGEEDAYWKAYDKYNEANQKTLQAVENLKYKTPTEDLFKWFGDDRIEGIFKRALRTDERFKGEGGGVLGLNSDGSAIMENPRTNFYNLPQDMQDKIGLIMAQDIESAIRKTVRSGKWNPQDPKLAEPFAKNAVAYADAYREELAQTNQLERAKERKRAPDPAPLKDDKWIDALVNKAVMKAVEHGKPAVSFANATNQREIWSERYMEGYRYVYDQKLPKALKKLGDKFGVEPKLVPMSDPEMRNQGMNWMIEITPEMRKAIEKHGLDLFGSIDGGLLKRRTPTTLDGGLLSGTQVA